MKLYDSVGPNPHVVRMVIAEKGMNIDTVKVDILKGENRQPDYMARNPSGHTPCLELDGGRHLSEITAIAEYLEEKQPSPPLIGATPEERAETRMWTRKIDQAIVEPLVAGFRATTGRPMFEPRMAVVSQDAGAEMLELGRGKLKWLDEQMQGRTWVCGERYTLADIMLYAFVAFGQQMKLVSLDGMTWLPDWFARAAARPGTVA